MMVTSFMNLWRLIMQRRLKYSSKRLHLRGSEMCSNLNYTLDIKYNSDLFVCSLTSKMKSNPSLAELTCARMLWCGLSEGCKPHDLLSTMKSECWTLAEMGCSPKRVWPAPLHPRWERTSVSSVTANESIFFIDTMRHNVSKVYHAILPGTHREIM